MCIFFKKILKMFLWMFLETKRINSEDDCIGELWTMCTIIQQLVSIKSLLADKGFVLALFHLGFFGVSPAPSP